MDGGMMMMRMPAPGPPMFRPRNFVPRMNQPNPQMSQPVKSTDQKGQASGLSLPQIRQQFLNQQSAMFDGKRMRKAVHRKTVDYNTSVIKYLHNRVWQRDRRDAVSIQPDPLYQIDLEPPMATMENPINSVTTKFVRTSTNKFRCPIFCVTWTPEGRRLVTGASSGEFTLWNGLAFNFETILQAHDTSVRAMRWSHNDMWMVTADHAGFIKYWQSNMNNVKMYQGHKEAVRGIRWESLPSATDRHQPCLACLTLSIFVLVWLSLRNTSAYSFWDSRKMGSTSGWSEMDSGEIYSAYCRWS